jgi:hypothetical protein
MEHMQLEGTKFLLRASANERKGEEGGNNDSSPAVRKLAEATYGSYVFAFSVKSLFVDCVTKPFISSQNYYAIAS